jgi:long-chain acyl-CoA synthetase
MREFAMNDALLAKLPLISGANGVADVLDFRARSHGEKDAVVCLEERVTYNQLVGRAKAVACGLQQLGVAAGDKVAVYLPNSVEFVAAFFGAIGGGSVLIPINPLLKPEEVAHVLADSRAKAIIVHQDLLPGAVQALQHCPAVEGILLVPATAAAAPLNVPSSLKFIDLSTVRPPSGLEWPMPLKSDQLPAVIVYTSGTTGKPKGAVLTHHNLLSVFPARLDLFDIDENDRCLATLPLCHIYGMTVVTIGTIGRAGTLVVLPKFEARSALQTIERERITILPAVPAMYMMMLHEMAQAEYDLSSLRLCFSGAAPMPPQAIPAVEARFGVPLIEGYGLTESACVATINPLHGTRKPTSVGPALPGVQVLIVDDYGNRLPAGPNNIGEIVLGGPNIMTGYYQQPEATQEVLRNGWLLTGDLGYLDEDGYLFIAGRKKELIIRGGANIYPREIEDVIARIPGVREVAVIGVPDEIMGERVKAVVAVNDSSITEEAIKQFCAQHLADYKVPRIVQFVPALPRNSTGKVLKRLLS